MKSFLENMLFASCLLCTTLAVAQQTPDVSSPDYSVDYLVQRYPAGSIQSGDTANNAISEVTESRTRIEARFAAKKQACYPKFFTTSCINKATEKRRLDLLAVRSIELEANSYIRHARVADRDRRLEQSAREREAENASRSSVPVPEIHDMPRETGQSDAQRAARAQEYAEKNAQRAERERQRQAEEESKAQQRAKNVERYEEKARESEARQKEVARRKAERAGEQSNK